MTSPSSTAWSTTSRRCPARPGGPGVDPTRLYGDRGYDSQPHRDSLRALGITPRLARRGDANGSGLGKVRWVVERTLSWLHQNRRLRVRYEREGGHPRRLPQARLCDDLLQTSTTVILLEALILQLRFAMCYPAASCKEVQDVMGPRDGGLGNAVR